MGEYLCAACNEQLPPVNLNKHDERGDLSMTCVKCATVNILHEEGGKVKKLRIAMIRKKDGSVSFVPKV